MVSFAKRQLVKANQEAQKKDQGCHKDFGYTRCSLAEGPETSVIRSRRKSASPSEGSLQGWSLPCTLSLSICLRQGALNMTFNESLPGQLLT